MRNVLVVTVTLIVALVAGAAAEEKKPAGPLKPPAQAKAAPAPAGTAEVEVEPLRGPALARIERRLGALRVAGHHRVGERPALVVPQRVDRRPDLAVLTPGEPA